MISHFLLTTAIAIKGGGVRVLRCLPQQSIHHRVRSTVFRTTTTENHHYHSHRLLPSLFESCLSSSSRSSSSSSSINNMPSPPYPYRAETSSSSSLLDLSSLSLKINKTEEKRQIAFEQSRKFHVELMKARHRLESPPSSSPDHHQGNDISTMIPNLLSLSMVADDDSSSSPTTATVATETPPATTTTTTPTSSRSSNIPPRIANLSLRIEEYVRFHAFAHFLDTGTLLSPTSCNYATDEEYLGGACMGLCQDLARYGMGRATTRDIESVVLARNLVQDIFDYLLQFDFRNGLLRRKYDGTKYALKSLETILYELSVTGSTSSNDDDAMTTTTTTTMGNKDDDDTNTPLLPMDELLKLQKRIEHRDELREILIKKCRDGQKAAKQSIYALHRKDYVRALKLLQDCETLIQNDLVPIIVKEPSLRYGSFANVIEEYVEGKLFYHWLLGKKKEPTENEEIQVPSGSILSPDDFDSTIIILEPEDYLGGLCDLTGEIGRFAVQQGTARNTNGVQQCLEATSAIYFALLTMERFPSNGGNSINKKMDQLRRSVEKLERMLYEMSLSDATGGSRTVITEADVTTTTTDQSQQQQRDD